MLASSYNLELKDLYDNLGIEKVDQCFLQSLEVQNSDILAQLIETREQKKQDSELMVALAPYVENFIIDLFQLHKEVPTLKDKHTAFTKFYECKRNFIQRKAAKTRNLEEDLSNFSKLNFTIDNESDFVSQYFKMIEDEKQLNNLRLYAVWALFSPEGKKKHEDGLLFKLPQKIISDSLVKHNIQNGIIYSDHIKNRDGFKLTDEGYSLEHALDHAHYCIYCHKQNKDSCSKGLKDRKTNDFIVNDHNVALTGCPLEEHISEKNLLKSQGNLIGSFCSSYCW